MPVPGAPSHVIAFSLQSSRSYKGVAAAGQGCQCDKDTSKDRTLTAPALIFSALPCSCLRLPMAPTPSQSHRQLSQPHLDRQCAGQYVALASTSTDTPWTRNLELVGRHSPSSALVSLVPELRKSGCLRQHRLDHGAVRDVFIELRDLRPRLRGLRSRRRH